MQCNIYVYIYRNQGCWFAFITSVFYNILVLNSLSSCQLIPAGDWFGTGSIPTQAILLVVKEPLQHIFWMIPGKKLLPDTQCHSYRVENINQVAISLSTTYMKKKKVFYPKLCRWFIHYHFSSNHRENEWCPLMSNIMASWSSRVLIGGISRAQRLNFQLEEQD